MPPTIEEKVAFLKDRRAYGDETAAVEPVETHMSWVFLAGDLVFKLKKPVKFPFLDFTELAARERNCREEVRLNRRLAPDIYLGAVPLTQAADGTLEIGGDGVVVDWLVEMRRLPQDLMLDVLLGKDALTKDQIDQLGDVLADFYRHADRPAADSRHVFDNLARQQTANREILSASRFDVDRKEIEEVLDAVDAGLARFGDEIGARVANKHYVEGHGDLRPEHVCFCQPLTIFDCLEFSADLRLIDPFDEVAFLGMECAFLGAPWIEDRLIPRMKEKIGNGITDGLIAFYAAFRATMRARLSLGHLHYGGAADRRKWEAKTDRYISLAQVHLRRIGG